MAWRTSLSLQAAEELLRETHDLVRERDALVRMTW